MIIGISLVIAAVFLAMNMGISGFSVSFAPSYGSGALNRRRAALLYTICVILGACTIGPRVAQTLVNKISYSQVTQASGLIIIISCAITMFSSNLLKVPQSTSFVCVGSFVGAGLFYGRVNWHTVGKIMVFALIFSVVSFIITVVIKRGIYPPRAGNLRLYEKLFVHREKFKKFIIAHDMYAGFSVGTNNVANVVAPLAGLFSPGSILLFLAISPFFGLGAYLGGKKVINSVSRDIVPVGEFSASVVSFITATFVLIASLLGLPTPYVQFTTFSLLGVSCVKDGIRSTSRNVTVKRILWVWAIVPIFTVILSFVLHSIFLRK